MGVTFRARLAPTAPFMKTITYNKLVRDKIPQIIARSNAVAKFRFLNNEAFIRELKKKLLEESAELQRARGRKESLNELSDVLEILRTIAEVEKLAWKNVERKRMAKNRERGGFKKKIFLEKVKELD